MDICHGSCHKWMVYIDSARSKCFRVGGSLSLVGGVKNIQLGSGGAVSPPVGPGQGPGGGPGGKAPRSSWISAYLGCLKQMFFLPLPIQVSTK